jgi:hypothetical protein
LIRFFLITGCEPKPLYTEYVNLFCLFVSPSALYVLFPRLCFHLPLFLKFGVVLFDFFFRCCCCCCVFSFVSVELLSPQAQLCLIQPQLSPAALLGAVPTSGPYLFTLDFMANYFSHFFKFSELSPRLWMIEIASVAYTLCDCTLYFIRPFGMKKHKIHITWTDGHVECVCV